MAQERTNGEGGTQGSPSTLQEVREALEAALVHAERAIVLAAALPHDDKNRPPVQSWTMEVPRDQLQVALRSIDYLLHLPARSG